MSQRIAVMYLGRIVELAPRDALFAAPLHPYTTVLLSAIPIPDPVAERARIRVKITGELPDPTARPRGCGFHPRCPIAVARCRDETPPLRLMPSGRMVACHLAEEHHGDPL
jgi:peptide/nickel transport system ATP-binding protein